MSVHAAAGFGDEMTQGLVIVNFSHPLLADQRIRVAELAGVKSIGDYFEAPVQLDLSADIAPQVSRIISHVDLSPDDWQTRPIVVILPGLADAAAALLAQLHGIVGHFVTIAVMARRSGLAQGYEVTQLLSLQDVRDGARQLRW